MSGASETWAELPAGLRQFAARPLVALRLRVAPAVEVGDAGAGARRVATVQGGVFEGAVEGLSGHVHAGGTDWIRVTADGATHLDARILLETRAGDVITMSYLGIRHGPPDVLERLAAGDPVDPGEYYFRTSPRFETSAPAFEWLNRVVAVGYGQRLPDGVRYSVFQVL